MEEVFASMWRDTPFIYDEHVNDCVCISGKELCQTILLRQADRPSGGSSRRKDSQQKRALISQTALSLFFISCHLSVIGDCTRSFVSVKR